jgi:DNA-binding NarL/FixJ family response regulator
MSDRPERAIRILLADASRITTMGIRQVIEKEPDMEIIGVASDGSACGGSCRRSALSF